jgi:hypothetical protein
VIDIIDSSNNVLGTHTIIASDFDSYGDIKDIDIALSPLDEGSHSLKVRVNDVAGNSDTSAAATVTVELPPPDTTPPSALIDVDSVSYNDTTGVVGIDLIGDASDAIVEYTLNTTDWNPATGSGSHREFAILPVSSIPPGVTLRVVDAAGNVGSGAAGQPHGTIVFVGSSWNENMGADGLDAIFSRGGDDTIMFGSPSGVGYIDGGSGSDVLSLVSETGYSFNASSLAGKLHNVEAIRLGALSGSAVMEVSDYHSVTGLGLTTLFVEGDGTASVNIGNGHWRFVENSGGYNAYSSNNVTLKVDQDILIVGTPDNTA